MFIILKKECFGLVYKRVGNWRSSSRIREPQSYSLYQERMKELGRIPAINQKVALISFNVRALNTREIMRSKDAQAFPLRHWFIGV